MKLYSFSYYCITASLISTLPNEEGHKTLLSRMTFFSRGRSRNISKRRPLILSLTKSLQIRIQFSKAKSDGIGLRLLLSKHPIVTDGEIKFDGATIHRCQLEPRIIKMGGNLCKVLIYIEFKSAQRQLGNPTSVDVYWWNMIQRLICYANQWSFKIPS